VIFCGITLLVLGGFIATQNTQSRLPIPMVTAGIVLLILAAVLPAKAHDHNRPGLTPWFESLRSRANAPCCDGSDATRLDDIDWESKDGKYRVRLNGQWVDVPEDAVIDGPNRAGPPMVWPYFQMGVPIGVRCFMPGVLT
jgi:hypothetical protein